MALRMNTSSRRSRWMVAKVWARVHDHISEVVAAQAADAAAALDEPLAEGVEQVVPALAEGEEQAGEDEQADLLVLHGL